MAQALLEHEPAAPEIHVRRQHVLQRLLLRPEMGAIVGAIVIFLFFFSYAEPFRHLSSFSTVLYQSSTYGLMAVTVALLMIGGEFDLSAGVGVTAASLVAAQTAFQWTLNVWVGVAIALGVALFIGFLNGFLVVTTGIPSFLVTLSTFLMLEGLNIAITKLVTGQVASQDISTLQGYSSARKVFASQFSIGGLSIRISVIYWIAAVLLATWVLLRTKVGNWIYAVGGDKASARAVGVPVKATKVGLFMAVGFTAWLTGMHLLFAFVTVQSGGGVGNEFIYIICAVIGGCLLTGGYGTAVGSAIGAFIFGMASLGIVFAGWQADYFKFFLGVMLLLATLANTWVRSFAARR